MKIDTLKKKLHTEFIFSEIHESLETKTTFDNGSVLLVPHHTERQRPWMEKAYNEWIKGQRTIVLIAPLKTTCKYFKKYVTDVAEIRKIKEPLYYDNYSGIISMIIAVYWKRIKDEPSFTVCFN